MRVAIGINKLFDINGNQIKHDGIGTYLFNLLEFLKGKIDVVPIYQKTIKQSFHQKGLTQAAFLTSLSPVLQNFLPFNTDLKLEKKFDIFHSSWQFEIPYLSHKPVIATIHDAILFRYPEFSSGTPLRKFLKNSFMKTSIERATHLITISQAAKLEIMEYLKIPEEKLTVIYNGISPEWFNSVSDSDIKKVLTHYKITKPFFLHVGTLQPRKNIDRILQAYLALPEDIKKNHLLVFTGNRGWLSDEVFHQLLHLQNTGQVIWIPYSSFDKLRVLYQAANLLLFPSLAEGFGLPILEGFASGTPVITSKGEATEEIAGGAAYLIDPYSIDNLRQGMLELLESPTLRDKLIKKGRERVTHFSWEKCGQETIDLYSKFC